MSWPHIVLGASAQRRMQQVKEVTLMKITSLLFSYLVITMFKGRHSKRSLQASFDVILLKMEGWKGLCLSIAGRL